MAQLPDPEGDTQHADEDIGSVSRVVDQFGHPYLRAKEIPLQALKEAIKAKVDIKGGSIRGHSETSSDQVLYRELLDVSGKSAGSEKIWPRRVENISDGKLNDKFMTQGGTTNGSFTPIGFHPSELVSMQAKVIVCAGLADGYRLFEALGMPVACGVGDSSIRSIVEAIRPLNPDLVVAVDNDEAGKKAGVRSGVPWSCPRTSKDWSDLFQSSGSKVVNEEFFQGFEALTEIKNPTTTLDPDSASVADMLVQTPPARQWLIKDFLPANIVGLLAAAGGTGKSMLALQLAVSVASGTPFLSYTVEHPGSVIVFSAEDDRDECHRRLRAVVGRQEYGQLSSNSALVDRLLIFDRVGLDNRLTEKSFGSIRTTGFVEQIIEVANQRENCRLIILDPLSRFDGGEPNDNSDGTRLIEAADRIRRNCKATVLLIHHVNKGSIRDSERGQEAVRGASGLVDGARWVGLMSVMSKEQAKTHSVPAEHSNRYVQLTVPKSNYSQLQQALWLLRSSSGTLDAVDLHNYRETKLKAESEAEYRRALRKICYVLERNGPLPSRVIEAQYGGVNKQIGVAQAKVRAAIHRGLEDGILLKKGGERGKIFVSSLTPSVRD